MALVVKNPPANAGDTKDVGSIPGWGRSSRGGHGNPLQYSCLENPMDRGVWQAPVHGVAKSSTRLKWLSMHIHDHGERAHVWHPGHRVNAQQIIREGMYEYILHAQPHVQHFAGGSPVLPYARREIGAIPVQGHKTEKAQKVKVNGSQAESTLRPCLSDTRTCIPSRFPSLLKRVCLEIHVCCILWLRTSISMCRGLEGGVPPHGHRGGPQMKSILRPKYRVIPPRRAVFLEPVFGDCDLQYKGLAVYQVVTRTCVLASQYYLLPLWQL